MKQCHTPLLRRLALTALCALLCATATLAQNRIDRKIEHRTTMGASKFTSVVKRNPDTRKVEKVVKVLYVGRMEANAFADTFYAEAKTGNFTEKRDDNAKTLTLVLTVSNATTERIYVFEGEVVKFSASKTRPAINSAKITAIVVYKDGKG